MVVESHLVVVDAEKESIPFQTGEEWVDGGHVQDVQPNGEEEWQ